MADAFGLTGLVCRAGRLPSKPATTSTTSWPNQDMWLSTFHIKTFIYPYFSSTSRFPFRSIKWERSWVREREDSLCLSWGVFEYGAFGGAILLTDMPPSPFPLRLLHLHLHLRPPPSPSCPSETHILAACWVPCYSFVSFLPHSLAWSGG